MGSVTAKLVNLGLALGVALSLAGAAPALHAEETDPGDLAFWQSIQNSTNPAEYQAYLNAFPQGRFAGLARIRAQTAAGPAAAPAAPAPATPAPAAGTAAAPRPAAPLVAPAAPLVAPSAAPQPPAPPAAPAMASACAQAGGQLGPIVGDCSNRITVTPATGRVGQKFSVRFTDFPDPNTDVFVVVPAGTPDFDPIRPPAEIKILYRNTIYNRTSLVDLQIGPYAPGAYEARYLTRLYNNDERYEASARTPFSVR